jgi:hypothetical protein
MVLEVVVAAVVLVVGVLRGSTATSSSISRSSIYSIGALNSLNISRSRLV